jgi:MOSC domain-containing protein
MNGFRACLQAIVAEKVPEPEGDELVFFRQWLAERNLGLVPIDDAASFSWPGYWIGRVDGDAVLMYGSPSGPVDAPRFAGRPVEAGWLVAMLDLALDARRPYGTAAGTGTVTALLVAPDAEAPMTRVGSATAVAGRGLEGDRYGAGRGTFSGNGRGYELTLVAEESLAAAGVGWEEARRNVVTRGIDLNALAGRRFRVGEVECIGRRLAEPCAHLERLTRPGIMRPLVHRAGLRADILVGGQITLGDRVEPV